MQFDILTLFPDFFHSPLKTSLLGKALLSNRFSVHLHNFRDFAEGPHRQVDDTPYGGGAGMVLKPEPLFRCCQSIPTIGRRLNILFSPRGKKLDHATVRDLTAYDQLVLICGRYEGVDQRFIDLMVDEEISLGDFVLSGGELPALALIEAISRLLPGVLGNQASLAEESFASGLLEHPQYTRPEIFEGEAVPEVLKSGNHRKIEAWRREQAVAVTKKRRPDLINAGGGRKIAKPKVKKI